MEKIKCPNCKSNKTKKRGIRKTQNRGEIQRYYCHNCKSSFVQNEGFYRMRNNPQKITLCLDLFFRGVSLRKVQEHLKAFYPQNSSWVSIYSWVVKYSNMIGSYTDTLKLIVGEELQADEVEYKTKNREGWFIDVMDTKTRFIVSSDFIKTRNINEIQKVLKLAKYKTDEQIKTVTTDGLLVYPRVLRRTFGLNKRNKKTKIRHNIVIASENGFNHKIERLHSNIRERTKVFRGFGSFEGAKSIMKGYEIFYNFIRKHQAIGKCPYELATDLKLESNNKWLELIELSKKR